MFRLLRSKILTNNFFQKCRNSKHRPQPWPGCANSSGDNRQTLEPDRPLQHSQQGHVVQGYRENITRTSGQSFHRKN